MARRKPNPGDIVEIFWDDATADAEDHSMNSLLKDKPWICQRKVVGYYILTQDGIHVLCGDRTLAHSAKTLKKSDKIYSSLLTVPEKLTSCLRVVESSPQGKRSRKGRT